VLESHGKQGGFFLGYWELSEASLLGWHGCYVRSRSKEKYHAILKHQLPFVVHNIVGTYTSACGKRTLAPYTAPFRAAFIIDSNGAYFGFSTISSIAFCVLSISETSLSFSSQSFAPSKHQHSTFSASMCLGTRCCDGWKCKGTEEQKMLPLSQHEYLGHCELEKAMS